LEVGEHEVSRLSSSSSHRIGIHPLDLLLKMNNHKLFIHSQALWLTSVIPAMWEVEIGKDRSSRST
jgi:hypothetical protein